VSDFPWAAWDFLPTVAEIARAETPPGIDGISVLPLLLGLPQTNRHEYLYWEFHERGSKQAVRLGDWKGLRLRPGGPIELYDLKSDPGETRNLADEHPDIVKRIEEIMATARTDSERWPLRPPPRPEGEAANPAAPPANSRP